MSFKKSLIFCLVLSALLGHAQEGELSLDPNDIPLSPDPSMSAPEAQPSSPTAPLDAPPKATETLPTNEPLTPNSDTLTPNSDTLTPNIVKPEDLISPRVEEFKPTPSNLEVKPNLNGEESVLNQKEEKFRQSYSKFHKAGTSEQNWEKVIGKRTSDTYTVNKGDTLWDISGTLFGDPFYWPKVWSLNKDLIFNPHVIFPNMKIKFYQGDMKSVPTLATDNQSGSSEDEKNNESKTAKSDRDSTDRENDAIDDVPSNQRIMGQDRKLPKFFKDQELRVKKQVEVKVEEYKDNVAKAAVNLDFYLAESPIQPVGSIVEVESDFKSAGNEQFVFVKFDGVPTGTYTVLKPAKKLKENKESSLTAEIYEVEGEIRVLGKVNSEQNVFRTQVSKTNTLVSEGSFVVPGRMKSFKMDDANAESTAVKGRIIGNLNDYGFVGNGCFVLVNQGSQSGYQANMTLPIYEDLAKRNLKSLVKENPQKVGNLIIVESTQNFSIGYINRIFDSVHLNDFVGAADGGEFNPNSSAKMADEMMEESVPSPTPAPESELSTDDF